jgi:hypothetical protein
LGEILTTEELRLHLEVIIVEPSYITRQRRYLEQLSTALGVPAGQNAAEMAQVTSSIRQALERELARPIAPAELDTAALVVTAIVQDFAKLRGGEVPPFVMCTLAAYAVGVHDMAQGQRDQELLEALDDA